MWLEQRIAINYPTEDESSEYNTDEESDPYDSVDSSDDECICRKCK